MEIHEVQEALRQIKQENPDNYQMKDHYERRLLDLLERQKNPKGVSKYGKLPVFGKPPPSKDGDKVEEKKEDEPEKPNIALRIISLAKGILDDYFENSKFIEQLGAHS